MSDSLGRPKVVDRKGDWIQTFTGKQFFPLDAYPEDINIIDIAHALSMSCRYTGHCTTFYSVAEHSVRVSYHVPKKFALTALLHDASEAYLTDVPRPLKPFLTEYKAIELQLEEVIAKRFGTHFPMPPEVKEIDNRILVNERNHIMAPCEVDWNLDLEPLSENDNDEWGWDWKYAKYRFLDRFEELTAS